MRRLRGNALAVFLISIWHSLNQKTGTKKEAGKPAPCYHFNWRPATDASLIAATWLPHVHVSRFSGMFPLNRNFRFERNDQRHDT